jgi:hypothetical protein
VPHPRDALVFVARVGKHDPQSSPSQPSTNMGAPGLDSETGESKNLNEAFRTKYKSEWGSNGAEGGT